MASKPPKFRAKVARVMREGHSGRLRSGGSGKIVRDPKQMAAIAYSEARRVTGKKRKKRR